MVAHFRVQDSKMESIFKLLPILLGTVFGALLLTYRSHAKATDQFRNKKIEAQLKREEST